MALIKKIAKPGDRAIGAIADNLTSFDKDGNVVSYKAATEDIGKVFGIGQGGIPDLFQAPGGTLVPFELTVAEGWNLQYYSCVKANGIVFIIGSFYNNVDSAKPVYGTLFTLPEGFRPNELRYSPIVHSLPGATAIDAGIIQIEANGTVTYYCNTTVEPSGSLRVQLFFVVP